MLSLSFFCLVLLTVVKYFVIYSIRNNAPYNGGVSSKVEYLRRCFKLLLSVSNVRRNYADLHIDCIINAAFILPRQQNSQAKFGIGNYKVSEQNLSKVTHKKS